MVALLATTTGCGASHGKSCACDACNLEEHNKNVVRNIYSMNDKGDAFLKVLHYDSEFGIREVVDPDTGVHYLIDGSTGISVMYNADGSLKADK